MSDSRRVVAPDGRFDLTALLAEVERGENADSSRDVAQDDIAALFAARSRKKAPGGADGAPPADGGTE